MFPAVLLVALNAPTVLLLPNVVPPTELVANVPPVLMAPALLHEKVPTLFAPRNNDPATEQELPVRRSVVITPELTWPTAPPVETSVTLALEPLLAVRFTTPLLLEVWILMLAVPTLIVVPRAMAKPEALEAPLKPATVKSP